MTTSITLADVDVTQLSPVGRQTLEAAWQLTLGYSTKAACAVAGIERPTTLYDRLDDLADEMLQQQARCRAGERDRR
jgi:hypothetical protein